MVRHFQKGMLLFGGLFFREPQEAYSQAGQSPFFIGIHPWYVYARLCGK